MNPLQKKLLGSALVVVNVIAYSLLAFFVERTQHAALFSIYALLFVSSTALYFVYFRKHWKYLFWAGIAFRLVFLVATPKLSDDFFRFTWDGELSKDGYSVFQFVPNDYKKHIEPKYHKKYENLLHSKSSDFPEGMNSKTYFSIYPTVNQFVFFTASFVNSPNNGSLIVLRVWILIAEVLSFFLLRALLRKRNKEHLSALYWLQPIVVIELVGNLHFEALAITFILAALYFASKNRWVAAGFSVGLGILTKLTPLFLIGAFFKRVSLKRWIGITAVAAVTSLGLLAVIINLETLENFRESLDLFFELFAFNAAIYYLCVEIGTEWNLDDVRDSVAELLPKIAAMLMFCLLFVKKLDTTKLLLLLYTTYFFLSPIVHPWYVTLLLPLAILSETVFPIVWGVLIFGTYSAYGVDEISAPLSWIYLEYGIVFIVLVLELIPFNNGVQRLAKKLYASTE